MDMHEDVVLHEAMPEGVEGLPGYRRREVAELVLFYEGEPLAQRGELDLYVVLTVAVPCFVGLIEAGHLPLAHAEPCGELAKRDREEVAEINPQQRARRLARSDPATLPTLYPLTPLNDRSRQTI